MVRLIRAKKSRQSELKMRGLYVLPGELKSLRETHLRDAVYLDNRGRRISIPGELRNVYTGLAEADYLMQHGRNKEEKFRGGKLKKQFIEMEQDLLKTMTGPLKRISCPSPEARVKIKEEIRRKVFNNNSSSKFDKAKLTYKELLENSK